MSIRQFGDYNETQGYGDYSSLPKGGYAVRIMDAVVCENSRGQYVKVSADIAEGEFKGYYTRDFENQQSESKKWRCNYLLSVPNDDGTERDGWTKRRFKTFIDALEDSNPGYHFDWDETKFKGLLIGGLFNEREYEKNDGTIGRSTNFAQVVSVDRIRSGNYKVPDDKLIKKSFDRSSSGDDNWVTVPKGAADELPFD